MSLSGGAVTPRPRHGQTEVGDQKIHTQGLATSCRLVYTAPNDVADARMKELINFNSKSIEFATIVVKCLRDMACAENLPWGRSAVQPSVYLALPDFEMVVAKHMAWPASKRRGQQVHGATSKG